MNMCKIRLSILLSVLFISSQICCFGDNLDRNITNTQNQKTVPSRGVFSFAFGYSMQKHDKGEFKEALKNSFPGIYNDTTHSINMSIMYDRLFFVSDLFIPFIGIDVNVNIPASDNVDIKAPDALVSQVSYHDWFSVNNLINLKLRVGNQFQTIPNKFHINIYAMAGLSNAMYTRTLGRRVEYSHSTNIKAKTIGSQYAFGYTYGFGVDFIIARFFLIGFYYETGTMKKGKQVEYNESVITACYDMDLDNISIPLNKFKYSTFGVRFGVAIPFI